MLASLRKVYTEPFDSVPSLLDSVGQPVNQALRDGAETLLISAEDLFDMHSAHELEFSAESERNALVSVRAILHRAHGRRWERRNGPQRWTEWEKAQRQWTKSLLS